MTFDNLGHLTILLGNHFEFPHNFKKLFNDKDIELKNTFKINLNTNELRSFNFSIAMESYTPPKLIGIKRRKKIEERSMEELVGSSLEEFIDSDRYETTI